MGKRNQKSRNIILNASDKDLIDARRNCPERVEHGCTECPIVGGKCIMLESEIIRRFETLSEQREQIERDTVWIAAEKSRLADIRACIDDDGK